MIINDEYRWLRRFTDGMRIEVLEYYTQYIPDWRMRVLIGHAHPSLIEKLLDLGYTKYDTASDLFFTNVLRMFPFSPSIVNKYSGLCNVYNTDHCIYKLLMRGEIYLHELIWFINNGYTNIKKLANIHNTSVD